MDSNQNSSNAHVVIIYDDSGSGHKKTAQILKDMLSNGENQVTLVTASTLVNEESNFFVRAWNFLIHHGWIQTADLLLNFWLRILLLPIYYLCHTQRVFDNLDRLKPALIIGTFDANRLFSCYARERRIPFFAFNTEASVFVDMLAPYGTHLCYFNEVAELVRSFKVHTPYFRIHLTPKTPLKTRLYDLISQWSFYGILYLKFPYFGRFANPLKPRNELPIHVIGPIREKAFFDLVDPIQARKTYGIPEKGRCVMISNGSLGGKKLLDIIQLLYREFKIGEPVNFLVICGKDEDLAHRVFNLKHDRKLLRFIPINYMETLAPIWMISDCSIGRASAGMMLDSLFSRTPILVNERVTSNDCGTLDMLRKYNFGECYKRNAQISALLQKMLEHPEPYKKGIDRLWEQYDIKEYENQVRRVCAALSF